MNLQNKLKWESIGMGMGIVNRQRFTTFCIVLVLLLIFLGYGMYLGGVWVMRTFVFQSQEDELQDVEVMEEMIAVNHPVTVPVEVETDPLLEELEWLSRFVLGCEGSVLLEEGVASLTFDVISKTALNYYPRNEMTSRIYKQTLKVLQDVSKIEQASELKGLKVLYVDSRFVSHENPVGEVMSFSFDHDVIQDMNWDNVPWLSLEDYKEE